MMKLPFNANARINRRIALLIAILFMDEAVYLVNRLGFYPVPPEIITAARTLSIVIIGFLVVNVILRFTENRVFHFLEGEVEIEQRILLTKLYKGALYLIPVLFLLVHLGLSFQNLTLFVGLVATGIALAMRELIMSYLVWIIIILKNPVRIGDGIRIGDTTGLVSRIGTMYLSVRPCPDVTERVVRIPNKTLLDHPIVNFGRGVIADAIRIPLETPPRDWAAPMERIRASIERNLPGVSALSLRIDIDAGKWVLAVEYTVDFAERDAARTRLLGTIAELYQDLIAPAGRPGKRR
ncbi:MAG TPA: mechanosensitive ion channel [Spirochaetota bacterium]|nr:mechanosensitive ion channel [Spirochaetota bacterium]